VEFVQLVDSLGQAPESPAVLAHLQQAGVTQQPRPKQGEYMAYVQFEAQGYEMRFDLQPDGMHLYLSSVTAYVTGDATHKPFAGVLPASIERSDTRETLAKKLGPPPMHNKITNVDGWPLGSNNLVVAFDKANGQLKRVQVNVPAK
jgi:hypothetical protein